MFTKFEGQKRMHFIKTIKKRWYMQLEMLPMHHYGKKTTTQNCACQVDLHLKTKMYSGTKAVVEINLCYVHVFLNLWRVI